MKCFDACLAIGGALALLLGSGPVAAQPRPTVSSIDQVFRTVVVRDIKVRGNTVSGVLVNHSPRLLREVRVLIRYAWRWKNERHPGENNPGRGEYVTLPGELPASGTLPFTHNIDPPLPVRSDGHFDTSAEVIGFTEVGN
jgi:hypothetical protein